MEADPDLAALAAPASERRNVADWLDGLATGSEEEKPS